MLNKGALGHTNEYNERGRDTKDDNSSELESKFIQINKGIQRTNKYI